MNGAHTLRRHGCAPELSGSGTLLRSMRCHRSREDDMNERPRQRKATAETKLRKHCNFRDDSGLQNNNRRRGCHVVDRETLKREEAGGKKKKSAG